MRALPVNFRKWHRLRPMRHHVLHQDLLRVPIVARRWRVIRYHRYVLIITASVPISYIPASGPSFISCGKHIGTAF